MFAEDFAGTSQNAMRKRARLFAKIAASRRSEAHAITDFDAQMASIAGGGGCCFGHEKQGKLSGLRSEVGKSLVLTSTRALAVRTLSRLLWLLRVTHKTYLVFLLALPSAAQKHPFTFRDMMALKR